MRRVDHHAPIVRSILAADQIVRAVPRRAREAGVVSPLVLLGLDKQAVRELSHLVGLPGGKPTQSCLATRFPYHTTLTREALARIGAAEAWLRARGFTRVRLRLRDELLHLELPGPERAAFLRPQIHGPFRAVLQRLGFPRVELG